MITQVGIGGSVRPAWVVGVRGQEQLVCDDTTPIRWIQDEITEMYDPDRVLWSDDVLRDGRPPHRVAEWLDMRVFKFDKRAHFRVINLNNINTQGGRSVKPATDYQAGVVAGMVIEHLTDLDVLRLKYKSPSLLVLDRWEFDAWIASALLALGDR